MPIVSVIIPNYNHAPFLNQRINSVLNQTFQDFEVIILDDCSTDDSRKVIKEYKNHPKISHIIFNETNSGSPFKQWEKGISLAQGEWIWIAESDDWCDRIFLEELITAIQFYNSENLSIAFCQSFYFKNGTGNLGVDSKARKIIDYLKDDKFIEERMLPRPSIFNASMAIFKKENYLIIPKDFEKYKFCGDWLFWIELGKKGDTIEVGKLLNYHRVHQNNTYSINSKKGNTFIEELQIIDIIKSKNWATKKALDNSYRIYYQLFLKHRSNMNKETYKQVRLLFTNHITFKAMVVYRFHFILKSIYRKLKYLLNSVK